MRKYAVTALVLVMLLAASAVSARMEQISKQIDPEGAERIVIEADLGGGQFNVTSRDMKEAALIDIEYDPKRVDCEVDYRVKSSSGYLILESSTNRGKDLDTDRNIWDVTLSTRYPVEMRMEFGACDAEMDLGGIPLEELSLEVGAASGAISFSQPNPARMRDLSIDAGASSLEIVSLGNARFDEMSFQGGVGSFDIDFRGKYEGESEAQIEIGLGSANITIPRGLAVRIETEGGNWLSSVDFHDDDLDEVDDNIYETPGFDEADDRLVLIIEVGLGSVDIYFKD
jgi:hypothetical protein